ncbi:MAG: DUF3558 domain-containing protein [Actinomycetota bacterium]|nr:DUF3558 domain-containing protein [Actinomycetota bacterium]
MGNRTPRLAIAAATVFLIAGCSDPVAVPPLSNTRTATTEPASPVAPTTSRTVSTSSSSVPSTRPADIDLTAVDPCGLATGIDPASFGLKIDPGSKPRPGESAPFPGSKICTVSARKSNVILGIELVTTEGFTSYTGSIIGTVEPTSVAGYPAALIRNKPGTSCFSVVDVKDGQMLYIQATVGDPKDQPPQPQDALCDLASKITEAGMKSLPTTS